jgi:hypothetical protein
MPLLDRYLVQIWEQSGGCAPRFVPFSEIRDLIYEEDDSDLSEIIQYVGDYSTPKGTDIATDLAKIWEDVYPKSEPDGSSLEERMAILDDSETGKVVALEGVVGTPSFEATISEEVSSILSQIPSSVDRLLTPPGFNATPTYAYARLVSGETGPTEGDTVTVNDIDYTFVDALTTDPSAVPGEVVIAILPKNSLANLAAAVNGSEGEGSTYATGTAQPDNITATVAPATPSITFTTDIPGDAGNNIGVDFSGDDFDWDGDVLFSLIGGADVTTAINGTMVLGTNGMLYISDGPSGGLVSNWKKIPLWAWSSYITGDDLSTRIDKTITALETYEATAPEYVATFSTATAASAVLTSDTNAVTNGSKVTVDDVTYTFVTALTTDPATVPNEVLIGANSDESLTNLKLAINGEGTEGTNYSTDTDQPTDVTAAVDTDANTVTVTATTKGVVGNAYRKDNDDAHLDWDGPADKFSGGVDGQVGATGKIVFTASAVYCCTDGAKCIITDSSGWKSADFS